MNYVCTQLITDSNGVQTCQTWTEYNPPSGGLLPPITKAEAQELATPIIVALCVAWCGKRLLKLFGG